MLERLRVGPIGENVYLLPAAEEGRCLVVDPGDEAARIVSLLDGHGLVPSLVVATHGHLDHTAAIPELLAVFASRGTRIGIAVHCLDADYFGAKGEATNRAVFSAIHALGYFKNYWHSLPSPELLLAEGDFVPGSAYRVIHTPGHTRGSICLYDEAAGILVSGDTLFQAGAGRTDGPDSEPAALERSISRLLALPPETRVFPGHGEPTTIGAEAPFYGAG